MCFRCCVTFSRRPDSAAQCAWISWGVLAVGVDGMESLQEEEEARRREEVIIMQPESGLGDDSGGRAAGWASDVTIRERVTEINGPALLIGSALSLSLSPEKKPEKKSISITENTACHSALRCHSYTRKASQREFPHQPPLCCPWEGSSKFSA
jgi:hypothetical protein